MENLEETTTSDLADKDSISRTQRTLTAISKYSVRIALAIFLLLAFTAKLLPVTQLGETLTNRIILTLVYIFTIALVFFSVSEALIWIYKWMTRIGITTKEGRKETKHHLALVWRKLFPKESWTSDIALTGRKNTQTKLMEYVRAILLFIITPIGLAVVVTFLVLYRAQTLTDRSAALTIAYLTLYAASIITGAFVATLLIAIAANKAKVITARIPYRLLIKTTATYVGYATALGACIAALSPLIEYFFQNYMSFNAIRPHPRTGISKSVQ